MMIVNEGPLLAQSGRSYANGISCRQRMSTKLSSFQPARRSQNLVSLLRRGQGARQGAFAEYWMELKHSLPPELSLAKRPPRMSVIGGRAENICSFRVFLSLTLSGSRAVLTNGRRQVAKNILNPSNGHH